MQDGNNLFDEIASTCDTCCPLGCWGLGDTLDETIVSGVTEEILIVGVFNTPQRLSEYTYSQDTTVSSDPALADQYLDFIEHSVIPLVKQKIRIANDAKFGLLGSSLGGLLSCYGGWTRPHVYDVVGCMSSSFWWNLEDFNRVILHNGTSSSSSSKNNTTFYLDSGTGIPPQSDDDEFETLRVKSSLLSLGKKKNHSLYYYLDDGGQHSEMSWGRRFWIPISLLFPGSTNTTDFFLPPP
jgi:predicted alpha/beta superfamily hydrolase